MSSESHQLRWFGSNNLARLLVALVLISNLYAALGFFFFPQNFVAAYELAGAPGEAAVAGIGLLFLMWQVPYVVALINPCKHKLSLLEALVMQFLGVIGETFILLQIPIGHTILRAGITRFIIFDFTGLVLMILAWLIVNRLVLKIERKNEL